jgi:hypothetical protein
LKNDFPISGNLEWLSGDKTTVSIVAKIILGTKFYILEIVPILEYGF